MTYADHRQTRRQPADARPAKAGVVVILILALVVGGGVYTWKTGLIGTKPPANPAAKSAPAVAPSAPGEGNAAKPSGSPKRPSSIFDDTGSDGGEPSSPTVRPVHPSPAEPTSLEPAVAAPDLATLEAAARDAEQAMKRARGAAIAGKLQQSPSLVTRQAEVDKLEAALKQARAVGTPRDKIDASAAWNKARLALDKEYEAAIASDPAYAAAKSAAQRSADALKAAKPATK